MENQEINKQPQQKGKRIFGAAILVIGLALFAKQVGVIMPNWLFSWPMILIIIGIASGIKHKFRNASWLILILIGSVYLLEKIEPGLSVVSYTWPVILIGIGIWFILGKGFKHDESCKRRRRRNKWRDYTAYNQTEGSSPFEKANPEETSSRNWDRFYSQSFTQNSDEFIDSVSIFGGVKRNILTKNFRGGDITTIMGGAEINLANADINGIVVLDVLQMFGGTKIIVPPTWDVTSEMAAVFGGIDDKRSLTQVLPDRSKVLMIKGTSIFGGIEIRNF